MGISPREIQQRIERGTLHRVVQGVYAVGCVVHTPKARLMTAVLAGGPGAAAGFRSAAMLRGIREYRGTPEVIVPADRRPRPGIRYHQAYLPADEVTVVDGIPVTTVPRTLLDLASVVPRRAVGRALRAAEDMRLYDALDLRDIIDRYPGRRGIRTIRAILVDREDRLRSDLEEEFMTFADLYDLPLPRTNYWVFAGGEWFESDCAWPEQRLIVELDSRRFHDSADSFESDRRRDRTLAAAGWRTTRVTWSQIRDEPAALAADLRVLLAL